MTVDVLNSLPDDVATAPSLNILKHRLDYHWRNDTFLYDYKAPLTHAHASEKALKGLKTEEDMYVGLCICMHAVQL